MLLQVNRNKIIIKDNKDIEGIMIYFDKSICKYLINIARENFYKIEVFPCYIF